MKVFTSHLAPRAAPVLVREGMSWGAFFWGPLWFFAHRAWIAGVLNLALAVAVFWVLGRTDSTAPFFGLLLGQGLFGRDLLRWSLARRGYTPGPVLAARDRDFALARLLGRRPELTAELDAARV